MDSFTSIISKYGSFPVPHSSGLIRWPHWDLLHLHQGVLSIGFENRTIEISRSQSLLIPPGTAFRIVNTGPVATASVQYFVPVPGSAVSSSLSRILNPFHYAAVNSRIEAHINELLENGSTRDRHGRKEELLLELIVEKILIHRSGKEKTVPWKNLIREFRSRLENPPSIEELAHWAGYSPSRFRAVFQNDTGLSPAVYFHKIKMESASVMLAETILPVKDIAGKHGYKEVSHFNRAFVKHFGIPPGKYRRMNLFQG